MEEKMILKRQLFPLPPPSSYLPYSAASCPLFILQWDLSDRVTSRGRWRVLFAAVAMIDRWGVSLRLSWMKSNMWTSRTHSCASVAHSRNDTVDPEAVWPLVMKSLLFSVADVGPFVHETIVFMICSDLCHQPSWFPVLIDSAGTRRIVLLPILDTPVNTCSPVTDSVTDCNSKPIIFAAQDNVSNIVHLSGWANGRCNISHALHGIFDTTTIVSCYQYRVQYNDTLIHP